MRATAARYRGNLRNLALSFKSCSDKGKILAIGVEQYCVPRAPGAVYDFQPPQNLCLAVLAGEHIFPDAPPPVQIGMAKSTEFTKTERKVLRYLLRGLSYPCIASEMGIEMSTVKFHVTNMLQKTGLENKLQLALAGGLLYGYAQTHENATERRFHLLSAVLCPCLHTEPAPWGCIGDSWIVLPQFAIVHKFFILFLAKRKKCRLNPKLY